jgi:hypothetical protein
MCLCDCHRSPYEHKVWTNLPNSAVVGKPVKTDKDAHTQRGHSHKSVRGFYDEISYVSLQLEQIANAN